MGIDVTRVRLCLILAATLMTATCVSISGIVGWVGLLIPHIVRMLVGPGFPACCPCAPSWAVAISWPWTTLCCAAGGMSVTNDGRTAESRTFSLEQVILWDPDVLLVTDARQDITTVYTDSTFRQLKAARRERVYVAPVGG